ncbi:MAG: DUF2281 domain-containing protein [Candidatus Kapabacteria bacterium]|nr:DUF2281 domain-containing protein [Candidatus Kapabacteria bacterium]
MPITLELPPEVLDEASKYAASEGISLDELTTKALIGITKERRFRNDFAPSESLHQRSEEVIKPSPLGLLRGVVLYMADDFDAPLEDFREYME